MSASRRVQRSQISKVPPTEGTTTDEEEAELIYSDDPDSAKSHTINYEDFEDSADEYIEQRPARKPRLYKGKGVTRNKNNRRGKASNKRKADSEEPEKPQTAQAQSREPTARKSKKTRQSSVSDHEQDSEARDNDDEDYEAAREILKKRGQLEAVKARVPIKKYNSTWPVISDYGLSKVFEMFESEGLACLSSLKDNSGKRKSKRTLEKEDNRMKQFQQAQQLLLTELYDELSDMPVPPSTRNSHFTMEALETQNTRLEALQAMMQQQVTDLKAEIKQEEEEMAQEERYLKELVKNSKSQISARRDLLRKRSEHIDVSVIDNEPNRGGDTVDDLNMQSDESDGGEDEDDEDELSEEDSEAGSGFDDEDDELRIFKDRGMTDGQLDRIVEELRQGGGGEEASPYGDVSEMEGILRRLDQQLDIMAVNRAPLNALMREVSECDGLL